MTSSYAPEPEPTGPVRTGPVPRTSLNGPGLAALIVGVLALIGSVIPIVNYGSGFLAFIGIVLGIIGLILANRPKRMALGGLAVSIVALILSVILAIAYTAGVATVVRDAVDELPSAPAPAPTEPDAPEAPREVRVTYELTGSAPTAAAVRWSDDLEGTLDEEAADPPLPWTAEETVSLGSSEIGDKLVIIASVGAEGGDLVCRILIDGQEAATGVASGAGELVYCIVRASELAVPLG